MQNFVRSMITNIVLFSMTTFSVVANAHEAGSWIIKGGSAKVAVNNDSDKLWTDVTGSLPNTVADANDDTQLGISVTYMLTNQMGLEVLGATPFSHDIKLLSSDLGGALDGLDLASTKHLPPTVSLQYYLIPNEVKLMPYVGVGLNYTFFFQESLTNNAKSTLGATDIALDSSYGFAFQVGVDYMLTDNWLINASVMYANIETEATIDADGTDALAAGIRQIEVVTELDPYVYRLNIGYKF